MEIFIVQSGERTGPFSEEQIQMMVNDGQVSAQNLAWHANLSGWLPLNQVLPSLFVSRSIFIVQSGQKTGPFSETQIQEMLSAKQVELTTLAWHSDLANWMPLKDVVKITSTPTGSSVPPPPNGQAMFLYIPTARLIGLSVASVGLYLAYWNYYNWRFLKNRDGLDIDPFWRGIFYVFFIASLLKKIKTDPSMNRIIPADFSSAGIAIGIIALAVIGFLIPLVGFLACIVVPLVLLPVQNYIHKVNDMSPSRPSYTPWSTGHNVCVGYGVIVWLVIIVAIFG